MAQVNFRIDDETKRQAEELFGRMGLTMSSAIAVFLKQAINDQAIPFRIQTPEARTLTKEELLSRIDDVANGRNCGYHELMAAEDEREYRPRRRGKVRPRGKSPA